MSACPQCAAQMNYVATESKWFCNRCADWREGAPPAAAERATADQPVREVSLAKAKPNALDTLETVRAFASLAILATGIVLLAVGHTIIGGLVLFGAAMSWFMF